MRRVMGAGVRAFKTKTFDRWAKGVLSDGDLWRAAQEVLTGRFEADLGGGVCKKRVAAAGRGKSGATRVLIAKKSRLGLFFIAGRQKNDPGRDFSDAQVDVVKMVAKGLNAATGTDLDAMLGDGSIKEIRNGTEDDTKAQAEG